MSVRGYYSGLVVVGAALLGLVACGAEGPLTPTESPARSDASPSISGLATSSQMRGGQPKVTICHVPPGNPDNAHVITVGQPALPAHVAHGDTLGECQSGPVCSGECSGLGEQSCRALVGECRWTMDVLENEFCEADC